MKRFFKLKPNIFHHTAIYLLSFIISSIFVLNSCAIPALQENGFYPLSRKGVDFESETGLFLLPNFTRNGQLPLTKKNLHDRLYSVRLESTSDAITGGIALRINFDAGSKFTIVYIDIASDTIPKEYLYFTFYAKASNTMGIKIKTANGISSKIQILQNWKKFLIPIDTLFLGLPLESFVEFFAANVQPENGYIIFDRIGFETDTAAAITIPVTVEKDPIIKSSDFLNGSEYLISLREHLKNKKRINVFAWGDSITRGVQMNRGNNEHPVTGTAYIPPVNDIYYGRMVEKLKNYYKYNEIFAVTIPGSAGEINEKRAKKIKFQIMKKIKSSDIIIIQYGGNDFNNGKSINTFIRQLGSAVDDFQKIGAHVIVLTPPLCDYGDPGANAMLEPALTQAMILMSKNKSVPVVNLLKFMVYRGDRFGWAWESNRCHPDFWGMN